MPQAVAIVVLNWNRLADTLRCIASLERQTYPNFRILVVDNGSTDGSVAALRALGERITLIESAENLGYTGGNNLAIRAALKSDAGYVWLFNNDAVAEADALALLVAAAEADPKVGLASPFLRDPDGDTADEFCGGRFDPQLLTFDITNRPEVYQEWALTMPNCIWLYGTALLLRRALIERIGFLDEKFFAYVEDNDLSLRSTKEGFKNIVVTNSIVFHSFSYKYHAPHYFYYTARNQIFLIYKHARFPQNIKTIIWILHQQLRRLIVISQNPPAQRALYVGVLDGLIGHGGEYNLKRIKLMLGKMIFVIVKYILVYL